MKEIIVIVIAVIIVSAIVLLISIPLYGVSIICLSAILSKMLYCKRQGVVVLRRKTNWIYTSFSISAFIRYKKKGTEEFKNDCEKFFNALEKGKIYTTETHGLILKAIKKKDVELVYEKTKKKRMFTTKLIIGNTNKMFAKYQYYKVCFKLK